MTPSARFHPAAVFSLVSFVLVGGATACDGPNASAADAGVDGDGGASGDSEPAAVMGITAAHNAIRAQVMPAPAEPLPEMVWSGALAEVAQAYAEQCVWEHSMNGYGENLFMSTFEATPDAVVESWASESADYDYASNTCAPGRQCGHYTQVVWADSNSVGCGVAQCDSIAGLGGGGYVWVCNYDPPGNWIGQRPYVAQ